MAWRSGHGKGAGSPRIEVLPADELPDGAPAEPVPEPARGERGRLRPGPGTTALAARAGRAAKESRQLAKLLGLVEVPEGHPYRPYARMAREWRDHHMARLAESVGGGEVGPGPAAIVSSAAMQLAASRWAYDLAAELGVGGVKLMADASRWANDSRQNLLAAHELCAKEWKSRQDTEPDDLTRQQLEFQRELKAKGGGSE